MTELRYRRVEAGRAEVMRGDDVLGIVWRDGDGWHARCECGAQVAQGIAAAPTRRAVVPLLRLHRAQHRRT